jgi:hypothetical protein
LVFFLPAVESLLSSTPDLLTGGFDENLKINPEFFSVGDPDL